MELKKKLYTAAQVSRRLKVPLHVLRYWETEFEIKPERNSAGRRIYTPAQVEKLAQVKFLRHHEKLTVQGTRSKLAVLSRAPSGGTSERERKAALLWIKKELVSLRDVLSSGDQHDA
jgi:DNA-binding transcriptional MerR regulator